MAKINLNEIFSYTFLKDKFTSMWQDEDKKFSVIKYLISLSIALLFISVSFFQLFNRLELISLDYRFKVRDVLKTDPDIVMIDMAEDSIEQIGRWPWTRDWHATLVAVLKEYDAKMVNFDVIFSEPSDEFTDKAFEEAIKMAGNVYLPVVFEAIEIRQDKINVEKLIYPIDRFLIYAKGSGHINFFPDSDGILRKAPLFIEFNGVKYFHISFKMAMDLLGIKEEDIEIIPGDLVKYSFKLNNKTVKTVIHIDKNNQILLSWAGKWQDTFRHYSYIDIIVSYQRIKQGLRPIINLNNLKGKICFIGLTATGLSDIKPIPIQTAYPAVGVNANLLNNILLNSFLKEVSKGFDYLAIIICSLFTAFSISRLKPARAVITVFLILLVYVTFVIFLFTRFGIVLNMIYASVAVVFVYLSVTIYSHVISVVERGKLFTLATRDPMTNLYNIRYFTTLLQTQMEEAKISNRKMTLMMFDIDFFKQINDVYGHQAGDFVLKEVSKIIKAGGRMLDIVARYGGEEFIMMLPGCGVKNAINVAEGIRTTIESRTFKFGNKNIKLTISIGVAEYTTNITKDDFIKQADQALYQAKESGRNRVKVSE